MEKKKALSLKEKLQIILDVNNKVKTKKDLASYYSVDISTINRIIRNQNKLKNICLENANLDRKRLRSGIHKDIEKALGVWLDQANKQNETVTSATLLRKAKEFSIKFKVDFEPTNGWLWRWQKRENIRLNNKRNKEEHNSTDDTNNFLLHSLLDQYAQENIFAADESQLFYKTLPNEAIKGPDEERVTLLLICNIIGEYKDIMVVGDCINPSWLQNDKMPLKYESGENAKMTSTIWKNFILKLDNEMMKRNRRILLFVDNDASHKVSIDLKNINLQFLPSNSTTFIQPMTRGIIQSFKSHYRQIIMKKQILCPESGKIYSSFTLFDALSYIKEAWQLVQGTTIKNSFRKAGFEKQENQNIKVFIKNEVLDNVFLPENFPTNTTNDFEDEECVHVDTDIGCYNLSSDEETVQEDQLKDNEPIANDNINSNLGKLKTNMEPSLKEIIQALNVLKRACFCKNVWLNELEIVEQNIFEKYLQDK